ncbi:helix-turn-helix domain-containing protein [Yinghuangia sp. YIM S09857]|uniref:helix-turn-helix domain-containing protein n=1 Tax=Yinghuangia sp. YIM S09857 TaxID=3436929 RepID=UPI003F5316AD
MPNLAILKNDRAMAVRFSPLNAICREVECRPGGPLATAAPQSTPSGRTDRTPGRPGPQTETTARDTRRPGLQHPRKPRVPRSEASDLGTQVSRLRESNP